MFNFIKVNLRFWKFKMCFSRPVHDLTACAAKCHRPLDKV